MTSTRLELDQLADTFAWPIRALASTARALDPVLQNSAMRRLVKAGMDFCCGAGAVVAAVGVGEGIRSFGVGETAALAGLVGLFLVAAETWGGSYRSIWRYTSLSDVITIGQARVPPDGAIAAPPRFGGDQEEPHARAEEHTSELP